MFNHVKITSADARRCHTNEFAVAGGNVAFYNLDVFVFGNDGEHFLTVVRRFTYIVVGDETAVEVDDVDGDVVGTEDDDVEISGTVVVVVVVEVAVVVVVDALTIAVPKERSCRMVKVARVRYPATVRWTPSAMNLLTLFGTK